MSGCVVLLIDESAAMDTPVPRTADAPLAPAMGGPGKSKAESVATAVNSLLNKLAQNSDLDIAVVGYRSDPDGQPNVGSRWDGALAGRDFVPASDLAASPLVVEQRTRKVPGALGMAEEQVVDFPIWYKPQLGDKAPQVAAFEHCHQLLTNWASNAPSDSAAPLVVNITAGSSSDGNPHRAVQSILQMNVGQSAPLVMQAHLGSSPTLPATLYPANRAYLAVGAMRDLFERASVLPDSLAAALKAAKVAVNAKAKAMIYNAKMVDLTRMLSLVQSHAEPRAAAPAAAVAPSASAAAAATAPMPAAPPVETAIAAEAPTTMDTAAAEQPALEVTQPAFGPVTADAPALIMFVLDRSVEDPYSANLDNACSRLQKHMSDLIASIAKNGGGAVDVGIVSFGTDAVGELEVRSTLGFAGRTFARDHELLGEALRVDEFEEEIPDGVGGLIKVPRKRPILVEVEPTAATPATPAFNVVSELISTWIADHPTSSIPPIVLHLTRGKLDIADAESAIQQLQNITTPSGAGVVIYHLVATEPPHATLLYPSSEFDSDDPCLQTLWRLSSPLLYRDELAAEKPSITGQSRGMVINGKFTLLLDALQRAMTIA